ncbi:hypothetical protein J7M28_05320 [bacterium]|nr:hypothetical protein [bacterium]
MVAAPTDEKFSTQLAEMNILYDIPLGEHGQIQEFLQEQDFLYPILKEAKDQIVEVFGENVVVCLELFHDAEEGWDNLFIVIKTRLDADEAMRLEDKLVHNWFAQRLQDAGGKLNIIEEPL